MCGIVAYIGSEQARPVLLEGLKRLEYRGYDSAGIAMLNGGLHIARTVGRVRVLEQKIDGDDHFNGTIGIAHTRWATHGGVTEQNAHPHSDDADRGHGVVLVHNGIIENHASLKTWLLSKGHTFASETDTEVLTHLIGELYEGDLAAAVRAALREVEGAYAIAVICSEQPDVLVAARRGSPLLIGVSDSGYIVASDAQAIVAHTSRVADLDEEIVATITRDAFHTADLDNIEVTAKLRELEVSLDEIELGDHAHYMFKEILEQPQAMRRCLRGRINVRDGEVILGGLGDHARELIRSKRVIFLGQGTALHAGMLGEYLMEDLAKVPAETDFASEFRYRNPIIEEGTVVVAVSQSGETADTLAGIREAGERGAMTIGLVNVVGSSIPNATDAGVYLRVGPEVGVASTKAFLGQVMAATMFAMFLGRRRFLSNTQTVRLLGELEGIPDKLERVCGLSDEAEQIAKRYIHRDNWLFLGRGYNYPVALEGALKLKELSYIHAEGMPAAEMKHGPIALIDEGMPAVFIATRNSQYRKVLSNIEEVKSRGADVIAVATEGDDEIRGLADEVFYVPDAPEPLQPLLTIVPLQLLAYHAALLRGHDVDKPRNLAKSVTVE
ncbi:MAG: glutamine--fructose-6-phosphate transaminase (isomerizing) [Planctomycetes bacterium]|jgi:glucosamine--fructose-6-phosphate aminotransferase (isomerizing)|nr:glutamine--fructose-6-phosphate transaminase (isomerizing) [Planctomycetota bacterium]MCP4837857.1 glutamine--fructose-6-phosphate transaminase (isomerizing) [Planctomycetota bacterium]